MNKERLERIKDEKIIINKEKTDFKK